MNKKRDPDNKSAPFTRRSALLGMAGAAGTVLARASSGQEVQVSGAARPHVPDDPTKVLGNWSSEIGRRSTFEQLRRATSATLSSSESPLGELHGTITPSDLHFERHHAGVPTIDPQRHKLIIHGMVDRPLTFSVDELKRFPAASRICFLECSGNLYHNAPERTTAQLIAGMTSQSEWTGVMLSTLLREAGVRADASWLLAEGADAAVLTRSIPRQFWDEAMIAYAQNGEAVRPENGYPIRLLNPGCEGNSSVKWLRRIEVSDRPFMTREETSKYTEPVPGGVSRQFSLVMDARSIITYPSYPDWVEKGWMQDHSSGGQHGRRPQLATRATAGAGVIQSTCPLSSPVQMGWQRHRHPEPRHRRDRLCTTGPQNLARNPRSRLGTVSPQSRYRLASAGGRRGSLSRRRMGLKMGPDTVFLRISAERNIDEKLYPAPFSPHFLERWLVQCR
jgi:sulfane dehydrogenase subunit SoxC